MAIKRGRVANQRSGGPTRSVLRSLTGPVLLAVAVLISAGCGASRSEQRDADATVERFYAGVQGNDGNAACQQLAPKTQQELEKSAGSTCARAIGDEDLPQPGETVVTRTEVYGQEAMVVMKGDTVFLARFPEGWKITAAGCEPQPGQPYDCQLQGA